MYVVFVIEVDTLHTNLHSHEYTYLRDGWKLATVPAS